MDSKLKGSTLIEVLVAMVITSIIITIAFMTFMNIQTSYSVSNSGSYYSELSQYTEEFIAEKQFTKRRFETNDGTILIDIKERNESPLELQISARLFSKNNILLFELNKIVLTDGK
jgi:Tfp pilus assembly protein PilE